MAADELAAILRAAATDVLPDFPIVFAYLYGSRTGEGSRPDSDVDVGIALNSGIGDPEKVAWRVADALTALVDELRVRTMLDRPTGRRGDTRAVESLRDRVDDLTAFRTALARAAGG